MRIDADIRMVGDWKKQMNTALMDALSVTHRITGRTMAEACKHALILMAQSAAKITKRGALKRPVEKNPKFRHLMRRAQYEKIMGAQDISAYFKFHAFKLRQRGKEPKEIFSNEKKSIRKIGNVGLAKKSWMWGLQQFPGYSRGTTPITFSQ